jgi:hypothetical protein
MNCVLFTFFLLAPIEARSQEQALFQKVISSRIVAWTEQGGLGELTSQIYETITGSVVANSFLMAGNYAFMYADVNPKIPNGTHPFEAYEISKRVSPGEIFKLFGTEIESPKAPFLAVSAQPLEFKRSVARLLENIKKIGASDKQQAYAFAIVLDALSGVQQQIVKVSLENASRLPIEIDSGHIVEGSGIYSYDLLTKRIRELLDPDYIALHYNDATLAASLAEKIGFLKKEIAREMRDHNGRTQLARQLSHQFVYRQFVAISTFRALYKRESLDPYFVMLEELLSSAKDMAVELGYMTQEETAKLTMEDVLARYTKTLPWEVVVVRDLGK